ncbi:hypothetical protein GS8_2060 [Geobacillus stearothermophilus]|uniref:Uncharacterized protein n=1 Tax=Geobacillus stearothermophilus TaxID=1422 RepID=A0A150MMW4_GEOSE|nr:hypothetical protein GS8_2060 [Geobacillus stearothermophilus]KYD25813.1 hypothetical protein B4109_1937 [Geobacillus stearothermophilus]
MLLGLYFRIRIRIHQAHSAAMSPIAYGFFRLSNPGARAGALRTWLSALCVPIVPASGLALGGTFRYT